MAGIARRSVTMEFETPKCVVCLGALRGRQRRQRHAVCRSCLLALRGRATRLPSVIQWRAIRRLGPQGRCLTCSRLCLVSSPTPSAGDCALPGRCCPARFTPSTSSGFVSGRRRRIFIFRGTGMAKSTWTLLNRAAIWTSPSQIPGLVRLDRSHLWGHRFARRFCYTAESKTARSGASRVARISG